MDRDSTRVPEVTRARAEPASEGIDGDVPPVGDRRRERFPGGSERTHDSSKDWRTDAS